MISHRNPLGFALASAACCFASVISGAEASPSHGTGDDAMPGVIRTDSAEVLPEGLALAVSSSYGFTGETLEVGDTHHRASARLAVAYRLTADLAVALRVDGRYDKHFVEAGQDDGWVGDPRFLLRYRRTLSSAWSGGVQLGIWAPGSNAPSIELDALSAEAVMALSWTSPSMPLRVSANAGYRLDRSAASVPDAERLSLSDRMSLGVSDYNAVLAAVGVAYQIGSVEALAEWSLDFLHGSGAPGFRSSPMRVALGGRYAVSSDWYLFGTSEFRVSKVEAAEVTDMLLPFDPRVSVLAGLQYRFGAKTSSSVLVPDDEVVAADPVDTKTPEVATAGPVKGSVMSDDAPVANATIVIVDASGREHSSTTGPDGSFAVDAVGLGQATLTVTADGFEKIEQTIDVGKTDTVATVGLDRVLPPGQLRGRVRSFRGEGLAAKLSVLPGNSSIDTDADGNFELDLPPGDYEVSIVVEGFKAQTRKIHVDENGVTIMNVDLRRRDRSRGSKR